MSVDGDDAAEAEEKEPLPMWRQFEDSRELPPRDPSRRLPDEMNPLLPEFIVPRNRSASRKKARKRRGRRQHYHRANRYRKLGHRAEQTTLHQLRDTEFLDQRVNKKIRGNNTGDEFNRQGFSDNVLYDAPASTASGLAETLQFIEISCELVTNDEFIASREASCVRCGEVFQVPIILPPNMQLFAFVEKLKEAGVDLNNEDPVELWPEDYPTEA